ncbi:MAG TPA: PQQ-binding-like beta-propeller repeat protein [Candidatus Limnocylindria bacterium]|jgi:outer membrane protein assembly factor BamB|nr:PQQ-binding-like beta-propeller repeat protein [Candidatus Limnocylindria bacterium]
MNQNIINNRPLGQSARLSPKVDKEAILYVGMAGSVVALEKSTGQTLWRRNLKSSGAVLILVEGNVIYASTCGHLFAINATTGEPLWQNEMRGCGFGMATLATQSSPGTASQQAALMQMIQESEETARNNANTSTSTSS